MSYTVPQLIWFFFLYGFLGWCVEVIFHAVTKGVFINRGFLIGPICPIYGFGMVAVLVALQPIQDNWFLVYLGSVVICSAIELLVGWVAEKFMHTRLWDYSNNFCNLGGYICLKFSLLWGVGCMFIVYLFHPLIFKLVRLILSIPYTHGYVLLAILSVTLLTDLIVTGFYARKLEGHMRAIEDAAKALERLSYGIGDELTDGTLKVQERRAEAAKQREKLRKLLEQRNPVHRHLLSAFPRLRQTTYRSAFERIQSHRKNRKQ